MFAHVWQPPPPQQKRSGHGTHCAGTIAGYSHGIAKSATVHAVKGLDDAGAGSYATLIAAVDWIGLQRLSTAKSTRMIMSASIGGPFSQSFNAAVEAVVSYGVVAAVAAGNDGKDACGYSPASSVQAITVGATNASDFLAPFSNRGACVDILAPGDSVVSTGIGGTTAVSEYSGTSMACPHVSGAAAILMSLPEWKHAAPNVIKQQLLLHTTRGRIRDLPNSTANKLLYLPPPATNSPVSACAGFPDGHPCRPPPSSRFAVAYCAAQQCVPSTLTSCGRLLVVTSSDALAQRYPHLLGRYTRDTTRICNGRATYRHAQTLSEIRWAVGPGGWVIASRLEPCTSPQRDAAYARARAHIEEELSDDTSSGGSGTGSGSEVVSDPVDDDFDESQLDASLADWIFQHIESSSDEPMTAWVRQAPCRDDDGDGYGSGQTGGLDCNDNDSTATTNTTDPACTVREGNCLNYPSTAAGLACPTVHGRAQHCDALLSCQPIVSRCGRLLKLAPVSSSQPWKDHIGALGLYTRSETRACGGKAIYSNKDGYELYFYSPRSVWLLSTGPALLCAEENALAVNYAALHHGSSADHMSHAGLDGTYLHGTEFTTGGVRQMLGTQSQRSAVAMVSLPGCRDSDDDGVGVFKDGGYDCDDSDAGMAEEVDSNGLLKCACEHRWSLVLRDSWGDGWNGNYVNILINHRPIFQNATFWAGETHMRHFTVRQGDVVTLEWHSTGQYDPECSFHIADSNGKLMMAGVWPFTGNPYTATVTRHPTYCSETSSATNPPTSTARTTFASTVHTTTGHSTPVATHSAQHAALTSTSLPSADGCQQTWQLKLRDAFGDGWNGNSLTLLVNDVPVHQNLTIIGGYDAIVPVVVRQGDQLTFGFNAHGLFEYECSFYLEREDGTVAMEGHFPFSVAQTAVQHDQHFCSDAPMAASTLASNYTTLDCAVDDVLIRWHTNDLDINVRVKHSSSLPRTVSCCFATNSTSSYLFCWFNGWKLWCELIFAY